jgi:AcrR family transcriptional regulator
MQLGKIDIAKAQRRTRIINAAEVLVRTTKSTNFSMQKLAETAGLSLATTYNLIGSKATVLYILLNRSGDLLSEQTSRVRISGSPIDQIERSTILAVDFFSQDPGFYRPLMQFLLGVPDPVHRPAFMKRAFDMWIETTRPLGQQFAFPNNITPKDLARVLNITFTGALDLWVHEELDDKQFQAQMSQALWLFLSTLADIDAVRAGQALSAARKMLD